MPLLADDYFFCAHDTISGRCLLSERTVGLGLASALLGELVLFGAVRIERGHLNVMDTGPLPDRLANAVLDEVAAERNLTRAREWLRYLARDAYDDVGQRLTRADLVERQQVRRLMRTTVTYVPRDMNDAGWPAARLATVMRSRTIMDVPDLTLAGIVSATGLATAAFADVPGDPRRYAHHHLVRLRHPIRESLLELIGHTDAAIGDAVLSHRT
ncbi:MAG: GPP34 family phosphoprotein [Actinophytocola sp.]|uniref:GOLPH3/VPS74 family protein n=1 Tax=Actinophytocola sp. TaxID=1872138 RepID=UPI003C781B2F